MKLYQDNGYVNIGEIIGLGLPFNFCIGGRATGKTYTSLKTVKEEGIKFFFMRRTQAQADLINKPEFSPFKSINRDNGWNIQSKPITKYNAGFYDGESETPIGYSGALSTISNIRGFDAQEIDLLIYDEFIPERHERPIKNEGSALLNAYETINRNRELNGKKPLQLLCLANANDISNPIFMELRLVAIAERMRKRGQEIYINRERGIGIFMLSESPISRLKGETALYKLTSGSEFHKMSIDNSFIGCNYENVVKRPLIEYKPVVSIGEICIYSHKNTGKLYISTHISGSPKQYSSSESDISRFQKAYFWIWEEYMVNNIEFEEVLCEILLTKYFR